MKIVSGNLKILALAGIILVAAAIVVQSCKKSSSPPAGPTVTSTTLAAGATVTAGTSTGLTISGTNLTGATVTTTAAGVTISNVVVGVGGTSITGTVSLVASVASGSVTLTITTPNGTTTATFTVVGLQLLGGYLSSDSVATANLISYFTFNGNVNDTVGNQSGTAVGAAYIAGVRGQAYQGSSSSYVTVPASTAFSSLPNFSVSVWYNLPTAAKPQPGGKAQGIFFASGTNTGSDGSEIILETDVPSATQLANDSVPIHNGLNDLGSPGWQGFTTTSFDTATSTWVHVVMTYNDTSSAYTFYENGQPIATGTAFGVSTASILYDGSLPVGSGSPATQLLGPLSFTPDPVATLFIGAWPPGLYGVSPTLGAAGNFQGAMDELRVYNIALKQSEVVGLYLNGLAGR